MTQSINDFIANFKGGARPNKWRIQIVWPTIVGSPNVQDEFVTETCQIPSSVVSAVQIPYKGRFIPYPGDRVIEPFSATFINDISFSHRNTFTQWLNLMNGHQSNLQATANPLDLMTSIIVEQLDRDDAVLKTITLINAFPIDMTDIPLDYQANDTYEQYQVQFNYAYWVDGDGFSS